MVSGDERGSGANMPLGYSDVEIATLALLRDYSGKKTVNPDQMINRDIGIYGWDGILILEELEEKFDLDLQPLVDSVTTYLPPTWWDKLRGRTRGSRVTDLTVRELIDYVASHAGEGRNEKMPRFL
jgi:hypothetical protein